MSSYTNTNYGPPTMGQYNVANGIPPTPQQQQQQQQQMSQQQQHQQQMLQKSQQQPFPGMPLPPAALNTNMSKFMPPSMTSAPTNALPGNYASSPSLVNGPQRPPTSQPPLASNLPPHMRPPGVMNGPSIGPTAMSNGSSTNKAGASASSSRTASPSLQLTQQQHHFPATSSNQGSANPIQSTAAAQSAINNLSGSMQSLNINRMNGAMPPITSPSTQIPPTAAAPPTSQQQPVVNSFQVSC